MKRTRKRPEADQSTPGFFKKKKEQAFFTEGNLSIQKKSADGKDRIHDPLLDQYSRDTGLPRESVTQHDPGYEAWLRDRSSTASPVTSGPVMPIHITVDMNAPASDPSPDYSRDETQLGAWEKANFRLGVQQFFSCDKIINNGIESSFVTDIGIRFTQANFEYFIARHIYENMNDRGREVSERIAWRQIHERIRVHAREHFVRYRQVVDRMRQEFTQRLMSLPDRNSPLQIPQQDLEAYLSLLLQHLVAKLRYELWSTTCNWEHTDYPNLLRGIPNVQGRFVPACGPPPVIPPEPVLPIVVTPSTGGTRTTP